MNARFGPLALGMASVTLTAPLNAQHEGHSMPAEPEAASAVDPHSGHVMPAPSPTPTPSVDADELQPADPHAGHMMGAQSEDAAETDPHAGHAMTPSPAADDRPVAAGTDLPAGNEPPPPLPKQAAADAVYGPAAMRMSRQHLQEFHGGQQLYQVMFNVAEAQFRNGRDGFKWDASAWYGGDIDRLWLKSEGEGEFGGPVEQAEVQALYSHAIGPYFNAQAGIRYDIEPNPSRAYAVVGIEGLAPSFFDVEAALFLSHKGELMARAEASYDQRITQRLILQPNLEVNLSAQDVPELGLGSGLTDAEAGLRLRYDIRREFAPYVGVEYRRTFGETRELREAAEEETGGWSFVTGIRWWF
jgi:copper resistance protein B